MATRQYIGARYVPKIVGEWNDSIPYEALSIVTSLGNSYTSKKPVPVGININNEEYWVLTGAYNEQVSLLQSAYDEIVEEVTRINAGKWIFLSDSYGNPNYGNWLEYIQNYLGLDNEHCEKIFVDGGSMYGGGILAGLRTYIETLSTKDKEAIAHVVYLGGINDAHENASPNDFIAVRTGLASFCNYVKSTLVNSELMIGYVGNSMEDSAILHGRGWKNIAKSIEIYSKCGEYGAKFLNNLQFILHDYSLMSSDGIHPTLNGGAEIAKYASSAIKTGSADVVRMNSWDDLQGVLSNIDNSRGVESGINISILAPQSSGLQSMVYQNNGTESVQLRARIALLTSAGAKAVGTATSWQIGHWHFNLFRPKNGVALPVEARAKLEDNTFIRIRGHITFEGTQAYMHFDSFGDNWSSPSTINVSQILLDPINWSVNTMLA